jgi:hypothetical protein
MSVTEEMEKSIPENMETYNKTMTMFKWGSVGAAIVFALVLYILTR